MSHQVTSLLQRYPPLPQSPHAAPSSHQEPTGISELFFSTCSKNLGAFPVDHPARLVRAPGFCGVSILCFQPRALQPAIQRKFGINSPRDRASAACEPMFRFSCTASSILGISRCFLKLFKLENGDLLPIHNSLLTGKHSIFAPSHRVLSG